MSPNILAPGFKPESLTVAKLRRLLTEYDVEYPAHAKKAELAKLFKKKIKPMIPELRKQQMNVRASTDGISRITKKHKKDKNKNKKESQEETAEKENSKESESILIDDDNDDDEEEVTSTVETNNDTQDEGSSEEIREEAEETPEEETPEETQAETQDDESNESSDSEKDQKLANISKENSFQSARYKRKADTETEELEKSDKNEESASTEKPILDFSYKKLKGTELDHLKSIKVGGKMADLLQSAIKDMEEEEKSQSSSSSVSENIEISSDSDSDKIEDIIVNVSNTPEDESFEQDIAVSQEYSDTKSESAMDQDGDIEVTDYNEKENNLMEQINDIEKPDNSIDIEALTNGTAHISPLDLNNNEKLLNQISGVAVEHKETEETPLTHIDEQRTPIPSDSDIPNAAFTGKLTSENSFLFDDNLEDNHDVELKEEKPQLQDEKRDVIEILDDDLNATDVEEELTSQERNLSETTEEQKPRLIYTLVTYLFKVILCTLIFAIGMIILNFGLWYREQRVLVGYCGQEINARSTHFERINLPHRDEVEAFLEPYKPQCLDCPEHGLCYKHMELKCKPGYRLEESLLSFHGLLPVSSYCVKDDRREKMVKEVVSKTLEILRIKNAQVSCGDSNDDIKSGLSEEVIREVFSDAKAGWISDEEFKEIWAQVLKELEKEPEMIIRQLSTNRYREGNNSEDKNNSNDNKGQKRYLSKGGADESLFLRSTSKKYLSMKCHFEKEVYQTYKKFRYPIWSFLTLVIAIQNLKYRIQSYFKRKEETNVISKKVVDLLKDKKISDSDVNYVSTVQLRDLILDQRMPVKEKNIVWDSINKKLERNTNIKISLQEVHGDIMKCLEWIGPCGTEEKSNEKEAKQSP
ncbi:Src1p [Nakaseomyces bracarensis]|uniref:Src1p n=1 Tax=Nakaseomyces bracarensis TaxID=273131 RepID=UPI00387110D1